jgi:hypothetical protein
MTWDSGTCKTPPLAPVPVPASGWDSGACASPAPEPAVTDPGLQELLEAGGRRQVGRLATVESLDE